MRASSWRAARNKDEPGMTTASITLHQPRRLLVGAGTVGEVGVWASDPASTLVIATPITAAFADRLRLGGKVTLFDAIPGEPAIATHDAARAAARPCRTHLLVGLVGGSVPDVAQSVALLWGPRQARCRVDGT